MGLYDGHGRKVVCFPDDGHPETHDSRQWVWDLTGDSRDELVVYDSSGIWIYTQDRPASTAQVYSPYRNHGTLDSIAVVSQPLPPGAHPG